MRARRPSRLRTRRLGAVLISCRLIVGLFAGPWALLAAAPAAWAGQASVVRVLLVDSSEPLEIRSPSVVHRVGLVSKTRELLVDGRAAGARWASSGEGPWRVGDLRYRGRLSVHLESARIQIVMNCPAIGMNWRKNQVRFSFIFSTMHQVL